MADAHTPGIFTSSPAPQTEPFAHVLVPVDFTPASRAAFALAARMTAPWNSEIILFHAQGGTGGALLGGNGAQETRSEILDQAKDHLRSFAETVVPGSSARVRIEARDDEEDIVASIKHACEELHASLVVMASSEEDRPRWRRSSAERVARALHCPVLVVPS